MASTPKPGKPAPPVPPEKPLPTDCCESGCDICVFDAYAEALEAYKRALAAYHEEWGAQATPGGDEPNR